MSEGRSALKNNMILRIFLLLTSIEGIIVILGILQSPSELASARLFGLSASRLVLLGLVLIVVLVSLGMLIASWIKRSQFGKFQVRLKEKTVNHPMFRLFIFFGMMGVLMGVQTLQYAMIVDEPVVEAFLIRLQPFIIWSLLISLQLIILLLFWRIKNQSNRINHKWDIFSTLLIFSFFILLWLWLAKFGYGFAEGSPERGVFRNLGTPLLGTQISLAVAVSFVVWWLLSKLRERKQFLSLFPQANIDLILGVMIWIAAFAIWMSAPLKVSWFADAPRPPNFTFSPNSDAYLYEAVSQSVLVGSGFWHPQWGPSVARPMYSALLSLFHLIGGLGYEEIIPFQVAFLSVFPAIMFYLTRVLHNRISGLLAAILVILREYNAIFLADTITVSHAKVLMADLPAALGGALILLLVVLWVKDPKRKGIYPLFAGGALGFFLLIRLEVWALFVVFLLAGLSLLRRYPWHWVKGSAVAILGFSLMIAPWVWRNWQQTQSIYVINPTYERRIFDKLFDIGSQSPVDKYSNVVNQAGKVTPLNMPFKLGKAALNLPDPEWSSAEKFAHHYFNSQVQSVLFLPMSPNLLFATIHSGITGQGSDWAKLCCSSEVYVRSLPYWWSDWEGNLASVSYVPMGIALVVLSVGINTLWKKERFLGLLPLLTSAFYFLFLALMGRSGGRWIQEVDWVIMLVLSVGTVEFIFWLVNLGTGAGSPSSQYLGGQEDSGQGMGEKRAALSESDRRPRFMLYLVAAMVILLVGATLPLLEGLVPQRYTQDGIDARVHELLLNENGLLPENEVLLLRDLLAEDVSIWSGRALYPRYFQADDGMDGMGGTYKRPFSRLEFFLAGNHGMWGVLPYTDSEVEFPHSADVLLIGNEKEFQWIEIYALVIYHAEANAPGRILWNENMGDS